MTKRGMIKPKPAKSKQSFEDVVIEMHTKIQVNILKCDSHHRPYGNFSDVATDVQQSFTDAGRCTISFTRDYADRADALPVSIKKKRVSMEDGTRKTFYLIHWMSIHVLPTDFLQAATRFWEGKEKLIELTFGEFMNAVCYHVCKMREK